MNRYLTYQDGELLFEDVALSEIAQDMYTPFYVYSKAAILEKVEAVKQAFAEINPMLSFNIKALDTTLIIKLLLEKGCAVSVENVNEIQRVLKAGCPLTSLILNSYALADHDIEAILKQKPLILNLSNIFDLEPLNRIATELDMGVRIGLRVNLDIETEGWFGPKTCTADSHPGIPKKDIDQAVAMIANLPQLNLVGLACNLGSQITQLAPWVKLSKEMANVYRKVSSQGYNIEYLNLGAGFPVEYAGCDFLEIKKIARNIIPHVKDLDCRVVLESGRYFTAEAGVLVASVMGVKQAGGKNFVICDTGFAELPHTAIYCKDNELIPIKEQPTETTTEGGAFALGTTEDGPIAVAVNPDMADPGEISPLSIVPTELLSTPESGDSSDVIPHIPGEPIVADIVGPGGNGLECLAKDIHLMPPERGDLLALLNVGAYGRSLSTNYASRFRPPEILIERDKFEIIRSRELIDDLIACDLEESEVDA